MPPAMGRDRPPPLPLPVPLPLLLLLPPTLPLPAAVADDDDEGRPFGRSDADADDDDADADADADAVTDDRFDDNGSARATGVIHEPSICTFDEVKRLFKPLPSRLFRASIVVFTKRITA